MLWQVIRLLKNLFALLLIGFSCLLILSCEKEPPLKIGFVGGLTGRVADLGVAGRDAVSLAVEEINASGGINGQEVQLLVKDDRQDAEVAKQAVRELIEAGAVAIIGPMTSSMAVVVQPLINSAQVVMVSPTAKSDKLSGQDDFFLRVTPQLSKNAQQLAAHVVKDLSLKKFAVVYDSSNSAFTKTWYQHFESALLASGGQIVFVESFASRPEVQFLPIAERLLATNPEGILLLSSAIDTALLAQQIQKLGAAIPLFSSEWASTTDLLSFGGRAVNGMSAYHSFNAESQQPQYLAFKEKFTRRFGSSPSFANTLAYDAATYLFAGLKQKTSADSLKETLINFGSFSGLQSEMLLDKYGDVQRRLFLTVIKDGQFVVVD